MLRLASSHLPLARLARQVLPPSHIYLSMPPKRTAAMKASGSKRKIEERDTDNEEETQRVESQSTASGSKGSLKRTKTEYFQNGQPKNKVLPVKIAFEKKAEGTLRIATWNVCGFAASQKKVRSTFIKTRRPLKSICAGLQILRRSRRS